MYFIKLGLYFMVLNLIIIAYLKLFHVRFLEHI